MKLLRVGEEEQSGVSTHGPATRFTLDQSSCSRLVTAKVGACLRRSSPHLATLLPQHLSNPNPLKPSPAFYVAVNMKRTTTTTTSTTTTTTTAATVTDITYEGRQAFVCPEGADARQQRERVVQRHHTWRRKRLIDERRYSALPRQRQTKVANLPDRIG